MKTKILMAFIAVLINLVFAHRISGQNLHECEIMLTNRHQVGQDSTACNEIFVDKNGETIFSWYGYAIIRNAINRREILCITADPFFDQSDTLTYKSVVLAIIRIDTAACELQKEIFASQLQSKPTKDLLNDYVKYKKIYKNVIRKHRNQKKADFLLRYCYDLTYAAMSGDSLAAERLLHLSKDFKLFRDGLDCEDLIRNREYLYCLYIVDKSLAYRKRFEDLSHLRYE